MGRHTGRPVKRGRRAWQRIARRYTRARGETRPHVVLGIEPGATPTQIKAAWRRLARQHHPDLTGDDPEASRVATRRMAEINEAYASLTRGGGCGPRRAVARREARRRRGR